MSWVGSVSPCSVRAYFWWNVRLLLDTSPSSAWPTTSLDNRAMPSPPLVAINTSTSPRPIPSSAIPQARSDDSLQEFLDRLGLSNYFVLFQVTLLLFRWPISNTGLCEETTGRWFRIIFIHFQSVFIEFKSYSFIKLSSWISSRTVSYSFQLRLVFFHTLLTCSTQACRKHFYGLRLWGKYNQKVTRGPQVH